MLVTLITDFSAVFYRKHIIYKRRMRDDLVKKLGVSNHTSFLSLSSSQTSKQKYYNMTIDTQQKSQA